jgi:hypothetical protein
MRAILVPAGAVSQSPGSISIEKAGRENTAENSRVRVNAILLARMEASF